MRVEFLGFLKDLSGVESVELRLEGRVSISRLESMLAAEFPELAPVFGVGRGSETRPRSIVIAVVNGWVAREDTEVDNGDVVEIMPFVGGG